MFFMALFTSGSLLPSRICRECEHRVNTEQCNLSSYFERVVPVLNVSQGTSDEVNLGFFLCGLFFVPDSSKFSSWGICSHF